MVELLILSKHTHSNYLIKTQRFAFLNFWSTVVVAIYNYYSSPPLFSDALFCQRRTRKKPEVKRQCIFVSEMNESRKIMNVVENLQNGKTTMGHKIPAV